MLKAYDNSKLKWFLLGVVSTLLFFILIIFGLFYFFTPLIKVDESTGNVEIFGGMVQMQAKNVITQLSKENSFVFGNISGVETVHPQIEMIEIHFGSGEVRVDFNATEELNWDCDGAGKAAKTRVSERDGTFVLDFTSALVDCDVSVPLKKLTVEAHYGDISIKSPQKEVHVRLQKGTVLFGADPDVDYKYKLSASSGSSEEFVSSESASAVLVDIEVTMGEINKLD